MAVSMNAILAMRRQAQEQQGNQMGITGDQAPPPPQGSPSGLQGAAGRRLQNTPQPAEQGAPLTPPVPGHPEAMQPTGAPMPTPEDQQPQEPGQPSMGDTGQDEGQFNMDNLNNLVANDQKQQAQAFSMISTPAANIMSKYGILYSIFGVPGGK